MRKAFIFVVGVIAVSLLPLQSDAAPVKLTKDQVATVCGKGITSSGGSSGCQKACGLTVSTNANTVVTRVRIAKGAAPHAGLRPAPLCSRTSMPIAWSGSLCDTLHNTSLADAADPPH